MYFIFNCSICSSVNGRAVRRGFEYLTESNRSKFAEPGAIERLGFDYETARDINPRIIFAQIRGYASSNPRADYLADDAVAQAVGGAASLTGYDRGAPLRIGATMAATGAALRVLSDDDVTSG